MSIVNRTLTMVVVILSSTLSLKVLADTMLNTVTTTTEVEHKEKITMLLNSFHQAAANNDKKMP